MIDILTLNLQLSVATRFKAVATAHTLQETMTIWNLRSYSCMDFGPVHLYINDKRQHMLIMGIEYGQTVGHDHRPKGYTIGNGIQQRFPPTGSLDGLLVNGYDIATINPGISLHHLMA